METQEEAEVESFAFLPTSVRNRGNHHADYESFDDSIESRGSVNSSYADLLEASDVVIRDQYDGSLRSVPFHYNPVTANLVKCKKSMIHPYYRMLQLIAWRPFAKDSVKFQCLWSSINIVYPLLILFLLFFWYIARVLTCQGMLSGNITPTTPKPPTPAPTRPPHNITNWTDILPAMNLSEYDLSSSDPVKPCRCKHIFGTYIVPNILYFLAYIIGFYHFRIQESEGLYALMEKVYLQSMAPQKITKTLQLFLYAGFLWLLCDMGLLIYFHYVFGLDSTTGIIPDQTPTMQYSFAAMLVFAGLVADVVNVAVIINFVGQCQLLKCYIEGITQRLEEKTTELRYAMKDILDVKQNISRVNGLLALNTSCVVFNMSLMTMVDQMNLFLDILEKLIGGISTWSKDIHSPFMIKRFSDFDAIIE